MATIRGEHEGNILFVLSGRAAAAVAAAFPSNCEYDPASGDIFARDQRVGNLPLVKVPGFRKIPGIPGESREVRILALPEERDALLAEYRGVLRDKIARIELEARRLRLLLEASFD